MAEATDLEISAGVRRELSGSRVDLSKLKFQVNSGDIQLTGNMAFVGIEKSLAETPMEIQLLETHLKAIRGVKGVKFQLENWAKSESGKWESTAPSPGKPKPGQVGSLQDSLHCPSCDSVIRFCPCCGNPLSPNMQHEIQGKPTVFRPSQKFVPKPAEGGKQPLIRGTLGTTQPIKPVSPISTRVPDISSPSKIETLSSKNPNDSEQSFNLPILPQSKSSPTVSKEKVLPETPNPLSPFEHPLDSFPLAPSPKEDKKTGISSNTISKLTSESPKGFPPPIPKISPESASEKIVSKPTQVTPQITNREKPILKPGASLPKPVSKLNAEISPSISPLPSTDLPPLKDPKLPLADKPSISSVERRELNPHNIPQGIPTKPLISKPSSFPGKPKEVIQKPLTSEQKMVDEPIVSSSKPIPSVPPEPEEETPLPPMKPKTLAKVPGSDEEETP
ncbi:hypothetical protein HYY75_08005, partial [bacterium]|nr:hypothetical protein [bacterium]